MSGRNFAFSARGSPKCPSCAKPVYEVEKVIASDGRAFHLQCFKCVACGALLKGNYGAVDGRFYCVAHAKVLPAGAPPRRPSSKAGGSQRMLSGLTLGVGASSGQLQGGLAQQRPSEDPSLPTPARGGDAPRGSDQLTPPARAAVQPPLNSGPTVPSSMPISEVVPPLQLAVRREPREPSLVPRSSSGVGQPATTQPSITSAAAAAAAGSGPALSSVAAVVSLPDAQSPGSTLSNALKTSADEASQLAWERARLESARKHLNDEREQFRRQMEEEAVRLSETRRQLGVEFPLPSPASDSESARGLDTSRLDTGRLQGARSAADVDAAIDATDKEINRISNLRSETKRRMEANSIRISKLKRKLERLREQRNEYKDEMREVKGALQEERETVTGMVKLTEKLQEEIQHLESQRLQLIGEMKTTKAEYESMLSTVVRAAQDALESKDKTRKLVGTWKIVSLAERFQTVGPAASAQPPSPSGPTSPRRAHIAASPSLGSIPPTARSSYTMSTEMGDTLNIALWSRFPRLIEDWAASRVFNPAIRSLPLLALRDGFNYEFGNPELPEFSRVNFEYEDYFVPFYRRYFFGREHANYVALTPDPTVVSIEKGDTRLKTIIWRGNDHERLVLPKGKDKLKAVQLLHPELSGYKFTQVARPQFPEMMLQYEEKLLVTRFKMGVLYCTAGQTTENQWYSNDKVSPEFEEFLEFLGDRIELNGWCKYKGGLQTDAHNRTGKYSYYTQFHDLEIMYHVAPLLPATPTEEQQLERKRHVGNDIVVLLFRDADCKTEFDPTVVASHFNHIFVVVQPEERTDGSSMTRYKVAIASRKGVPAFGPPMPGFGVYPKTPEFREFLLTKLVNAECAALASPAFLPKIQNSRKELLAKLITHTLSNGPGELWSSLGRETMRTLRSQFPGTRDLKSMNAAASSHSGPSPGRDSRIEKGKERQP